MASSSPKFLVVPAEVVDLIASEVDAKDLLSLRLTCKPLKNHTLPAFRKAWLTTLQMDLCAHSSKRLEKISRSEDLRHGVQELVFQFHLRKPGASESNPETLRQWQMTDGFQSLAEYTQVLRNLLCNRLESCRSFKFGFGVPSSDAKFSPLNPSEVFYVMTNILGDQKLLVRSLEVNLGNTNDPYSSPFAKIKPKSRFSEALGHVQHLKLQCSAKSQWYSIEFAADILRNARCLQSLSFTTYFRPTASLISRYIEFGGVPSDLKELTLQDVTFDANTFHGFLTKCANSLRKIIMIGVSAESGKNQWRETLIHLRDNFPFIEFVTLSFLKQHIGNVSEELVFRSIRRHIRSTEQRSGVVPLRFFNWPTHEKYTPNMKSESERGVLILSCSLFRQKQRASDIASYYGPRMKEVLTALADSIQVFEYQSDLPDDDQEEKNSNDADKDDF